MEALTTYLTDIVSVLITMPVTVTEKFFVVNVITFVMLAYLSYRLYRKEYDRKEYERKEYGRRERGPDARSGPGLAKRSLLRFVRFFRFLFPAAAYFSRSARIDYGVFLINILISPLIFVGIGLQTWLSIEIASGLVALNDSRPVFQGDWETGTYLIFILGYTLAADLSVYIVHRVHHQSDVLWPLHRLHHSATVLTPVTLFRKHPIWNLTSRVAHLLLTGLFQGLFVFVFYGGPAAEVLFGINTVYVLYNFFGANLRHSHVWLSWGKWPSHLFISPAMHQIHHDPERMNRNFGEVFAVWDWMFGTLYVPEKFEHFEIGLGDEGCDLHRTLTGAYWEPIRSSWQVLKGKLSKHA